MRIAVNTRFLLNAYLEGYGYFIYETLKRITAHHPEHEFIFIFDRPYDRRFIFSSRELRGDGQSEKSGHRIGRR